MKLRAYNPIKRAKWALLSLIFVVSQFGPLTSLVGTANAAGTYELASSNGIWTAVSGGDNVNGVNSNEVRWGYSTGQGQSGLRFDGQGTQSFNENDKINLGKLTHFNFPITNAANGATLKITLVFNSPSVSPNPAFTFQFNINETTNEWPCNTGWQETNTPCDDKITFPNSFPSQSFTIGDKLYTLKIEGFSKTANGADPISQFITEENKENYAYLIGSLSSVLKEAPALHIIKKVNGNDANTAPGESLTVGDTASFTYIVQNTGNVSLTNIAVSDDKGVTVSCPQSTLAAGDVMTCTGSQTVVAGQYTNNAYATGKNGQATITSNTDPANYYGMPRPGTLIVKKTVQNNNGGTLGSGAFNVHVKSGGVDVSGSPAAGSATGTTYNLAPGTYTVSEDSPASLGYHQKSIICDGQATATVTLVSGVPKTCEIINEDIAPTITLVKDFYGDRYGDTTSVNSFGLTIDGVAATSGQAYAVNANKEIVLNEAAGAAGYEFYSLTGDAKCPTAPGKSTAKLNPGENITCTIKNKAIAPVLKLVKEAINDNGGTVKAGSFSLTAADQTFTGNSYTTDGNVTTTSPYTVAGVKVGASNKVTISEVAETGYSTTKMVCKDAAGNTVASNTNKTLLDVTLALGQKVTCTVTNDDDTVALKLVKQLSENLYGASAYASDWTLKADGPGSSDVSGNGTATGTNLSAGLYNLSESSTKWPKGFTASKWVCVNNKTKVSTETSGALALVLGADYTCTITNTAIQPKLTVKKHVDNGNTGGTKTASDFRMNVSGNNVSDNSFNGSEQGTTVTLNVGNYTVSEGDHDGYTMTTQGDCNGSVNLGDAKTCTIKNTAIAPTLKLVKKAVNDNGGTVKAGGFTLTAAGKTFTGNSYSTYGNTTTTNPYTVTGVKAGAANKVTVSELTKSGYSVTSIICKDDRNQIVASTTSKNSLDVTLALGQNVTCTVTNDDVAPKLTLKKEVINNNSGTSKAKNWTLYATPKENEVGATTISGNGYNGVKDVKAKAYVAYTLSESGPDGYTAGKWECDEGYLKGNVLTMKLGEDVTCWIKNNDNQHPGLTIEKSGPLTAHEGDTVTYSFLVTNTGDTYLTHVVLDDDVIGSVTCPRTSLSEGQSMTCYATYTIPTPQVEDVVNKATVCSVYYADSWSDWDWDKDKKISVESRDNENEAHGTKLCATDTHTLDVLHPAIGVKKYGPGTAKVGNTVTYTFLVTNTGDEPLDGVTTVDSITGNGTYVSGDTNNDGMLDSGETWVYTATYVIPTGSEGKQVTNTVKACAVEPIIQEDDEYSPEIRILNIKQDVVNQPESEAVSVCATDTHTLTVDPAQELVNTGSGEFMILGYVLAATMLGGAFVVSRRRL